MSDNRLFSRITQKISHGTVMKKILYGQINDRKKVPCDSDP
jgi:hypothetical protein